MKKKIPIVQGVWQKLLDPTVSRGQTAYPLGQPAQERLGVRLDNDEIVKKADGDYYKYNIQPNAGKRSRPSLRCLTRLAPTKALNLGTDTNETAMRFQRYLLTLSLLVPGKIDASIKAWRDKNGETHAVITTLYLKKGSTKQEAKDAIEKAFREA